MNEFDIAYITSLPLVQTGESDDVVSIPELRLTEEKEKFEECIEEFEESSEPGTVVRYCHFDGTSDKLREVFTRESLVVHFSGHGESDCLMLEDEEKLGLAKKLTANNLQSLIGSTITDSSIKLLVLSACHSESMAEVLLDCGIPHIVAIRQPQTLEEKDAHDFLRHFYLALLRAKTIAQAFKIGTASISTNKSRQNFVLLPADEEYHKVVIFPGDHFVGQKPFVTKEPVPFRNFPRREDLAKVFLGRNEFMYSLCEGIKQKAIISVEGERGMGKTVLVAKFCEYLAARKTFKGFYYFDFSQMDEKYVQDPLRFVEEQLVELKMLDRVPNRTHSEFFSDLNSWIQSKNPERHGPKIRSHKHKQQYCIFVFDSLFESGSKKTKRGGAMAGNFKVRAQKFLLELIQVCRQIKVLITASEKPNMLKGRHRHYRLEGFPERVLGEVFLQTIPRNLWQKTLTNCRQLPLDKLLTTPVFKNLFCKGLDGRPSLVYDIYELLIDKNKTFGELNKEKDFRDIINKYEPDGLYINAMLLESGGAGKPVAMKPSDRTNNLTDMFDKLNNCLYKTSVFDEIWKTISIRQTDLFIPQFLQELLPFLVENTSHPIFKNLFMDYGVLKPVDIDHLTNEWSKNFSTMTSKVYEKFKCDLRKTLSVVLALGYRYWDPTRGIFHGHVGRNDSTDRLRLGLEEAPEVSDDDGVCLLRFSSKKGAIAIDRISRGEAMTYRLLVYIYLNHEKPFCWNSNSKKIFPFSTLQELIRYISRRYVTIEYVLTSTGKLLPIDELGI